VEVLLPHFNTYSPSNMKLGSATVSCRLLISMVTPLCHADYSYECFAYQSSEMFNLPWL